MGDSANGSLGVRRLRRSEEAKNTKDRGSGAYMDTGWEWGGKIPPPPRHNFGKSRLGVRREKRKEGEEKREKEKRGKGRKKKRKEREKEREEKEEKNCKLRVFLKDSFWLGVQAR